MTVPIQVEPTVRERLTALLRSEHFEGTGIDYSTFITAAIDVAILAPEAFKKVALRFRETRS